jgi:hypothetical protein
MWHLANVLIATLAVAVAVVVAAREAVCLFSAWICTSRKWSLTSTMNTTPSHSDTWQNYGSALEQSLQRVLLVVLQELAEAGKLTFRHTVELAVQDLKVSWQEHRLNHEALKQLDQIKAELSPSSALMLAANLELIVSWAVEIAEVEQFNKTPEIKNC